MVKQLILALASVCVALPAAAQQDYPSKPIKIIWPYPLGGIDYISRMVGQKLQERLGQSFALESRPGGNTIIGTDFVARQPADGYTILVTSDAILINPLLQKVQYSLKDFDPVALIVSVPQPLVVQGSLGVGTIKELVAYAKANPGKLSYASNGIGSPPHILMEVFKKAAGIEVLHVPVQGGAALATAVIGAQVDLGLISPSMFMPHWKAGKLKVLAAFTAADATTTGIAGVPTMAQAGPPGDYFAPWVAMFVPAGTPREVIRKLNPVVAEAVKSKEMGDRFSIDGMSPFLNNNLDYVAAFIKSEAAVRERAVNISGAKTDK